MTESRISAYEIHTQHAGKPQFIADADFFVPARKWFEEDFIGYYLMMLKQLRVFKYGIRNDCDNFSDLFHALAHVCNAQRNQGPQGNACGKRWYDVDADEKKPHAINLMYVQDGNDRILLDIEPQPPVRILKLEPEEKDTTFFMRW